MSAEKTAAQTLFDTSGKDEELESAQAAHAEAESQEPITPEVVPDTDSPSNGHVVYTLVPATIDDLATRADDFKQLIQARYDTVDQLRRLSIALTYPGDWLAFGKDDEAFGYLQGGRGCERVMQLWGVNVVNLGPMERIDISEPEGKKEWYYAIRGDGECNITKSKSEGFEGICGSDDDFLFIGRGEEKKSKKPLQLEKEMRHAARTRLDGIVTRTLTGLKAVPLSEIQRIWDERGQGEQKKIAKIPKGKGAGTGYGTTAERAGADVFVAPGYKLSESPKCPACRKVMKFVPKGPNHDPFWSCPDREGCGETSIFVPRPISSGRK